jgi:hypothetical protein
VNHGPRHPSGTVVMIFREIASFVGGCPAMRSETVWTGACAAARQLRPDNASWNVRSANALSSMRYWWPSNQMIPSSSY